MSIPMRRAVASASSLRALSKAAASSQARTYATIPTKNPNTTPPIDPSNDQAIPLGRFYEHILNKPQPYPQKKPEKPASSVEAESSETVKPATRGRPKKEDKVSSASAAEHSPKSSDSGSARTDKAKATTTGATTATHTPPSSSVSTPALASTSSLPPVPTTPPPQTVQEKANQVFGSRLISPEQRQERLADMKARSERIAGVLVPPRPVEPDNCCMSGCVNCVWDLYRDEMEFWAGKNAEAERALKAREEQKGPDAGTTATSSTTTGGSSAVSMDDDGGGSHANWDVPSTALGSRTAKDFWDEELYKNVPVGIKEFMKQEKRLKEKHLRDGTSNG